MFWKSKTKDDPKPTTSNSTALVRQDPRTSVKTETAQSETTNTSVQNATIFNNNTKTITYQTTRQTVTHQQQARVTEMITRRTPTPAELEEMLSKLGLGKSETTTTTTNRRRSGQPGLPALTAKPNSNGISAKSQPKFKSTATTTTTSRPVSQLIFNYDSPKTSSANAASGSANRSSTTNTKPLVQTQTTTVTQKQGRTFTSHTEQQHIKVDAFKISSPNSPLTRHGYADAQPLPLTNTPYIPISSATTYTSPYLRHNVLTTPQPNTRTYSTTPTFPNSKPAAKPTLTTTSSTTKVPTVSANKSSYISPYRPSGSASSISSTASTSSLKSSPFSREFDASSTPTLRSNSAANINTAVRPKQKSSLKPGYAYIFNNEKFDDPTNEYRVGSSEDVKALRKTFESFKLKVTVIDNATVDKIISTVQKIETKDYTAHSSLVIVILSHGSRYDKIAAKDGVYSVDDTILFPILRNRTLIDKPKMFFIQACKGAMEIGGFHKDSRQPHGSPNEILKCYSTFEGYVSYRTEKGSLFMQALCENLRLSGNTTNIKNIMETVTQIVKKQSLDKQIPSTTSTLTKPYIFGDYV